MSTLSLLVDCLKIITWLEDRKKLRKDWYHYSKAAQQKLKILLKDKQWSRTYPRIHDHLQTHQHSFNYNDVAALVDLMLATDLGQKNMLFSFSRPVMKQWHNLKTYMDKNLVNLLNVAKFIQQSLKFDLPALDKSIEAYDNQLATLRRKIDFNQNTIFQQKNALKKDRISLGVQQDEQQLKIEEFISVIIRRGPTHLQELQRLCRTQSMNNYLRQYNQTNEANGLNNPLQTLAYFLQKGDEYWIIYNNSSVNSTGIVQKYRQFKQWRFRNEWDIVVQGQENQEESKEDSSTVCQKQIFRQQLLYDLTQLLYFYKAVSYELANASKGLGFQAQNFKTISMVQGEADQAVQYIQNIINLLTSKKLTEPLHLKNQKKAYQVMVNHFKGFESNIRAMQDQIKSYQTQIQQMQLKRKQQVQKLLWLRKKVVTSKAPCEKWLGELVKKEVKITGQINKLQ